MSARVSVVIPAYNAARFLPEALETVFAQTYRSIDVIVVDDGSTDNTPDLLDGYGERIRRIRKQNGGIGSARNAGIRATSSEFLAFLDADDLWRPDKIERQVALMDKDLVICGGSGEERDEQGMRVREITYCEMLVNNPFSASSVMVHRSCLDEVGLFEERRAFHGVEDWDLWLRITLRYRALYLQRRLVDIRSVEGSVSSLGNTRAMLNAELEVLRKQDRLEADVRPGWRLRRMARSFRYFCAAWGELMQGNRLEAGRFMVMYVTLWPLLLLRRKPAALAFRIVREKYRG